jgi:hypothetical protein
VSEPNQSSRPTSYERLIGFNRVTSYLHSHRHRRLLSILRSCFGSEPFTMLDIGCASAGCFAAIHPTLNVRYLGVDIEAEFIDAARTRYGHLPNFRAERHSAADLGWLERQGRHDAVIALETFEHMPAGDVFRLLEFISRQHPILFACSVPIEVGLPVLIKNAGSPLMGYRRAAAANYSLSDTLNAACYRMHRVRRHDLAHRGFDWRWLSHTIHHLFGSVELVNLPFRFLPSMLSTNKFMYVQARPERVRITGWRG